MIIDIGPNILNVIEDVIDAISSLIIAVFALCLLFFFR